MTTKTWAYFLFGGSNGNSPETRFIDANFWGDISKGFRDFFTIWAPRALEQGATGIEMHWAFGADSVDDAAIHMFDQISRALANPRTRALAESFAPEAEAFLKKYPGAELMVYPGGFYNPAYKRMTGKVWLQQLADVFRLMIVKDLHVGFDASFYSSASSREEMLRHLFAQCDVQPWVEGMWGFQNRWQTRYPCITTESAWRKPWYTLATRPENQRVMRILDWGLPPEEITRRGQLGDWLASVRQTPGHEPAAPAHFWLKDGWNIAEIAEEGVQRWRLKLAHQGIVPVSGAKIAVSGSVSRLSPDAPTSAAPASEVLP